MGTTLVFTVLFILFIHYFVFTVHIHLMEVKGQLVAASHFLPSCRFRGLNFKVVKFSKRHLSLLSPLAGPIF